MGIFGQSSAVDADVEKATNEKNTVEDWGLIIEVCDKINAEPQLAKDYLKAIMKRMSHSDPHVQLQAITLLDACSNNCGHPFHLEVASREFDNEFRRLLGKVNSTVSAKMLQVLRGWAENDYKSEPALNLIPTLFAKLKEEGYHCPANTDPTKSAKASLKHSKDPNVVSSQQEEDDIAKAIELSLKEAEKSPKHGQTSSAAGSSAYPSLYPSFSATSGGSLSSLHTASGSNNAVQSEPRKVRALYDFEAAEENELTFFSGEIIHVLDDSDPNWWKGYNQRGEGLFPSNFVTADLSVDPERLDINQQNKLKKSVQFEDDARELQQKTEAAAAAAANQIIEIDENKVDRLLHLLHEANPEDPSQDSDEMLRLEQEVHQMGPLIDAELERVDRKHAQLTQLSSDLVDAINLYHSLMRDDRAANNSLMMNGGPYKSGIGMGMQMPPMGAAGGIANPYQAQMMYGVQGVFPPNMQAPYPGMTQLPQGYGIPQFANSMPPSTNSTGAPQVVYPQQMPAMNAAAVPTQFQNGHINEQTAGGLMQQPPQTQNGQMYNQMQQQPPTQTHPGMATLPPQQQQQQQPLPTAVNSHPQQFMSPQHQPMNYGHPQVQPQLQHYPPQSQPQNFMMHHQQQQPGNNPNNPQQQQMEQYSQLQQQMAAMSIAGMAQPATTAMPHNNDTITITNIPIQQQR